MVRSCQDLRDAVAVCLQRSECVLLHRHTPKECYEDPELNKTLPESCVVHILRYIDCKRGQADRTKRFRGNGGASTGKFVEDREKLDHGDFDPATELKKLSGGHVTAKADVPEPEPAAAAPEKKKGWFW